MAISYKTLIPPTGLVVAKTTVYAAYGLTAVIDKATVINNGNEPLSINVYLSKETDPDEMDIVAKEITIYPSENYALTEISGLVIEDGYFLVIEATAIGLVLSVSGKEIS